MLFSLSLCFQQRAPPELKSLPQPRTTLSIPLCGSPAILALQLQTRGFASRNFSRIAFLGSEMNFHAVLRLSALFYF